MRAEVEERERAGRRGVGTASWKPPATKQPERSIDLRSRALADAERTAIGRLYDEPVMKNETTVQNVPPSLDGADGVERIAIDLAPAAEPGKKGSLGIQYEGPHRSPSIPDQRPQRCAGRSPHDDRYQSDGLTIGNHPGRRERRSEPEEKHGEAHQNGDEEVRVVRLDPPRRSQTNAPSVGTLQESRHRPAMVHHRLRMDPPWPSERQPVRSGSPTAADGTRDAGSHRARLEPSRSARSPDLSHIRVTERSFEPQLRKRPGLRVTGRSTLPDCRSKKVA